MGFRGRLEEIRAPTSGKMRKSTPPNRLPTVRLTSQLLGTCAGRMSIYSGTLATNMATQRPASDHASKKATRVPPSPGLVPLPLPSLRYSSVLPSPSRYGKRYEPGLHIPKRSAEGQYLYESLIRPMARIRSPVADMLTSCLEQRRADKRPIGRVLTC